MIQSAAEKFLGLFGTSLRDDPVRHWQRVSFILIVLFALVEGVTWCLISLDFLRHGLDLLGQYEPVAYLASLAIGVLVAYFVLQLDRSIFMLDFGHLRFTLWQREAQREHLGELEISPPPPPSF